MISCSGVVDTIDCRTSRYTSFGTILLVVTWHSPFGGRVVEVGGVSEVAGGSIPLPTVEKQWTPLPSSIRWGSKPFGVISRRGKLRGKHGQMHQQSGQRFETWPSYILVFSYGNG